MGYSNEEVRRLLAELPAGTATPPLLSLIKSVEANLPASRWYRDYAYGAETQVEHVRCDLPELLSGGLNVVEVGPGVGCFMLVARTLGNAVVGEELPLETATVKAYNAITQYLGLGVRYVGFHRYITEPPMLFPFLPSSIDLFHFRGSLDGVLGKFTGDMDAAVQRLLRLFERSLRSGGAVWINHNVDKLLEPILEAIHKYRGDLKLAVDQPRVTKLVRL